MQGFDWYFYIIIGHDDVGANPKVNNILKAYKNATGELIWIMDSNVYVTHSCLRHVVDCFLDDSRVGLVHHIPCTTPGKTAAGILEGIYMSATHARCYSAVNMLGVESFVIGKSNIFRKSVLEQCGGIEKFGKYLSEDNEIGKAIMKLGYRHQVAPDFCVQSIGRLSFKEYISRRVRWTRIRKYVVTVSTILEPFLTNSIIHALTSSILLSELFNTSVFNFFQRQLLFGFASDFVLLAVVTHLPYNKYTNLQFLELILLWPISELMFSLIWIVAMLGSDITWRGGIYHCNSDGTGRLART